MPGSDYEAVVRITFDQAFHGTEVDFELSALEWDPDGGVRRVPHRVRTRIPRGVTNGEKLRVPGKGGKGVNGGPDGDLYLDIEVADHPLYRVSGNDLYVDLPLAPWEAVLGTSVELPTPAGAVALKIPPGTRAGQQLRLSGRGMSRGSGAGGPPLRARAHRSAERGRRSAEGSLPQARGIVQLRSPRAFHEGGVAMIAPAQDALRFETLAEITWTQMVHASGLTKRSSPSSCNTARWSRATSAAAVDVRVALARGRAQGLAPAPRLRSRSAWGQRGALVPRAHRVAGSGASVLARAARLNRVRVARASTTRGPGPDRARVRKARASVSPERIQAFLNALPANHEPAGETVHSVRGVLRTASRIASKARSSPRARCGCTASRRS